MKMLKLLKITLLATGIFFVLNTKAQVAPNISFTDVTGTTHDIYSYLNEGYTVFLDFSYQFCGPCKDWSINVGHDMWAEHGPDGDNTVRMFYFDIDPVSDADVLSYTQQWGVNYPVINLSNGSDIPEYPQEGYPTIYIICPDTSFYKTVGYGYPSAEMNTSYYYASCKGADLSNNKVFVEAAAPTSSMLCNATPLLFSPKIHIFNSETGVGINQDFFFNEEYDVKVFVNDEYHSTVVVDPYAPGNGPISNMQNEAYLEPFNVNPGDEVTLVIDFEGDNYPDDDTARVTVPSTINTNISVDSNLVVSANTNGLADVFFEIHNSEGQSVYNNTNSQEFSLPPDSCYTIYFTNSHLYSASLKDTQGNTLVSYTAGQFDGYQTPRLYFHVGMNTVDITEQDLSDKQLIEYYFLDLLGKRYSSIHLNDLPQGIYVQVKHYQNGQVRTEKIVTNQ
ncbi:MAG: hypothetical protein ISP71_05455 [Flavobacteriales bacterium]|nr:hypothetical protein [Flavobacteriales bacterium]